MGGVAGTAFWGEARELELAGRATPGAPAKTVSHHHRHAGNLNAQPSNPATTLAHVAMGVFSLHSLLRHRDLEKGPP